MAWTFGGATNNRIITPATLTLGGTSGTSLICGWYKPTTLTAGRAYWSTANFHSARVAATTSEMTLHTDNSTDGLWTTSGAGIVLNEWRFIAFMLSCLNTGAAAAWRVWVGTNENAPTEVTVTVNTAPAGNFSGGNQVIFGQLGTSGVVSYQGQIGDNMFIGQAQTTSPNLGPLATAAYGAITQAEADRVCRRIVDPVWKGEQFPDAAWSITQGAYSCTVNAFDLAVAVTNLAVPVNRITTTLNNNPGTQSSISGPTKSAERCPRAGSAYISVNRGLRRR